MDSENDNLPERREKSWSNIDTDVLQHLLMRLDVFTRQTCAGISQHWNGRIGELTTTNAGLLCTSPNIPPSIFGAQVIQPECIDFAFYDLYSKKSYPVQVPELKGLNRWIGGGHGWIVAISFGGSGNTKFNLVNPLTNEQVSLPKTYQLPGKSARHGCNFKKVIICRSPEQAGGYLLVGVPFFQADNAACLTPTDESWIFLCEYSAKRRSMEQCEDALLHDGRLYVLTSEANLYMYPIGAFPVGKPTLVAPGNEQQSAKNWKQRYLLECDGSMIMITRENGLNANINHPTRVYASKCGIGNGPVAWERVSNIGALVVFLGPNSNSTAITVDRPSCVEANNVYFIEPYSIRDNRDGSSSNVGQYDISRRLYRAFPYPQLKYPVWLKASLGRVNAA